MPLRLDNRIKLGSREHHDCIVAVFTYRENDTVVFGITRIVVGVGDLSNNHLAQSKRLQFSLFRAGLPSRILDLREVCGAMRALYKPGDVNLFPQLVSLSEASKPRFDRWENIVDQFAMSLHEAPHLFFQGAE